MRGLKIIFVTDRLAPCGGVETRLYNYCLRLTRKGCKIFILARSNDYSPLRQFTTGVLPKNRLLATVYLSILCRVLGIDIVEMHIKGRPCYKPWFCRAKLGIVIHNKTTRATRRFCCKGFDYSFVCSAPLKNKLMLPGHFNILPNGISTLCARYKFCRQKRAVLITRIGADRLPSIKSFIEFCLSVKTPFDIIGDFDKDIIRMLIAQYKLPRAAFKGQKDTVKYLAENAEKYLFAGGLGQVVLEAGALGMPCFIASLQGLSKSFFASSDNYKKLAEVNFSPSVITQPRFLSDMLMLQSDFNDIAAGKIERFEISSLIKKYNNLDDIFSFYYNIITNKNSPS